MAQLYLTNRPTFASGLAQSMEAMGGLMANQARSALMRQQLQEHQQLQSAMGQYAKTGDIAPVMAANPEVGMQLQQNVMKMHQQKRAEDIATLDKTIDTVEKYLPALKSGDFKQYQALRDQMRRILGPGVDSAMPQGFKSQDEFQNWIDNFHKNYLNIKTANEQVKAQAAKEREVYKATTLTPYQAGRLSEEVKRTGIQQGRLEEEQKRTGILSDKAKQEKKPTTHETAQQYNKFYEETRQNILKNVPDPEEQERQMAELNRRHKNEMSALGIKWSPGEE